MKYDILFFDVDETILDFKKAEKIAFTKLLKQMNLTFSEELYKKYSYFNHGLWEKHEKGLISQKEVVNTRFKIFFNSLGIDCDGEELEKSYQNNLALEAHFIEHALDVIKDLSTKYDLYILTNGVSTTQHSRLDLLNLKKYFKHLFISEEVGAQKPSKAFFDHVLKVVNPKDKSRILMIGDSLTSDILGGNNAGIDTCWVNRFDKEYGEIIPTYQISSLLDLYWILEDDKLTNYHMHTYLCGHASANIEDYIQDALKYDFDVLGFSEHGYLEDKVINNMDSCDFKPYLERLRNYKDRYQDKLKILIGLEMDYFDEDLQQYKNYLQEVDYLCVSVHFYQYDDYKLYDYVVPRIKTLEAITIYKNKIINAIKSGLFSFICHPDLFMANMEESLEEEYLKAAKEIILTAKMYDIPLEFNANGMRKRKVEYKGQLMYQYPKLAFFKLVKEYKCKVIVNSDSHNNCELYDNAFIDANKLARSLGLKVVNEIKLIKK